MRIKQFGTILAACLFAFGSFGAQPLEVFAKKFLGVDLGVIAFGKTAETNANYAPTAPPIDIFSVPNDPAISWMTNSLSAKYRIDFPNRMLRFGFKDRHLVLIRVSLSAFDGIQSFGADWDKFEERRKEMFHIQNELFQARKAQKAVATTPSFQVQYRVQCASTADSIFAMEIQFAPDGMQMPEVGTPPGWKKTAP